MRFLWVTLSLATLLAPLEATTLQQLPFDEMVEKSTAILRARVAGSTGVLRGTDVYTMYRIEIQEILKPGVKPIPVEVAVPGGVAGDLRQMVAGAPSLRIGLEYVMFLWTGRSGITQLIGLSQGLFDVTRNGAGDPVASRGPAPELMLDSAGHAVHDQPISMKLSDLKAQVSRALARDK